MIVLAFVTAVFCLGPLKAAAQTSPGFEAKRTDPTGLSERPYLDNKCFDYYRRPVLNIRNDSLSDVAFSDLMRHRGIPMGPMMIFNLKRLSKLSKASRIFFITHECGHHALGHLYFKTRGRLAEQEADCYAIRTLIRQGTFTLNDLSDVQKDMRRFARASLYHITGKQRANQLLKCIES